MNRILPHPRALIKLQLLLLVVLTLISNLAASPLPAIAHPATLARLSSSPVATTALDCSAPPITIHPPCDLQVFLLIDDSGSMLSSDSSQQRYTGVENILDILAKEYYLPAVFAKANFPTLTLPKVQVAMIHFSSKLLYSSGWRTINPQNLAEWDKQKQNLENDIKITVDYGQIQNTDFNFGFGEARVQAEKQPQSATCPRLVMLLTDGVPNDGQNLDGAKLDRYMTALKTDVKKTFSRDNDYLYVTAFESTASAGFWDSLYKKKWTDITGPGTIDLPGSAYVPTDQLAQRMESIVAAHTGNLDYKLTPLAGKPTQYSLEVLPAVASLRLTYFTLFTSASFSVSGPDGKPIQPNGGTVTLSGANTSIQVLEITDPAPGTYQVTTSIVGGQLSQLVRFQDPVKVKLVSPADPVLQFTQGNIAFQLLGANGKPLAPNALFNIHASLAQTGNSADLALSAQSDSYTSTWMPLVKDEATVSACALLQDKTGKVVDLLFNGPVGVIEVAPLGVRPGKAQGGCVPSDQDQVVALQLVNTRTKQPAAVAVPVKWTVTSTSSPGGGKVDSSIVEVDAKSGQYALHFKPVIAADVLSDITASATVKGTDSSFFTDQVPSTGFIQTRKLALTLGPNKTLADQFSAWLYSFFFRISAGADVQILFGRHWFGWFGPTQVEVSGRYVDTLTNQDAENIRRFWAQLTSLQGGPSSAPSNTWQAPAAAGGYSTLDLAAPGLGQYAVSITDKGTNPPCATLADLPKQTVLLVNDFWEYILILIILLILLLLLWWLFLYRNRLWGVIGILDKDKDYVLWKEHLSHPGKHDGKTRYHWVLKKPICRVQEIRLRSWDQPLHHVLIIVETTQGRQSFKRSLDRWENCVLPDGCEIAWWPKEPHLKRLEGPYDGDDRWILVGVDEKVMEIKDSRGDEVLVDKDVAVLEDKKGDIVEVEKTTVVSEEEESGSKKEDYHSNDAREKKDKDDDDDDRERKRNSAK